MAPTFESVSKEEARTTIFSPSLLYQGLYALDFLTLHQRKQLLHLSTADSHVGATLSDIDRPYLFADKSAFLIEETGYVGTADFVAFPFTYI